MTAGRLTLVLGGIRSGKSAFAEELVRGIGLPTVYVATGQATDDEMAQRIRLHRERRPPGWTTVEEPLELGKALAGVGAGRAVMIDSVDTWVGNLIFRQTGAAPPSSPPRSGGESCVIPSPWQGEGQGGGDQIDHLLEALGQSPARVVMVSSEVGHGLVSPNELGRRFQDLLGTVNQRLATAADDVYLVVAGIPMKIKGGAAPGRG